MIFSLLNVRKKTSASIAGITIAGACLWGVAMWQDLSWRELADVLLGSILFLLGIVVCALLLITVIKLLMRLIRRLTGSDSDQTPPTT